MSSRACSANQNERSTPASAGKATRASCAISANTTSGRAASRWSLLTASMIGSSATTTWAHCGSVVAPNQAKPASHSFVPTPASGSDHGIFRASSCHPTSRSPAANRPVNPRPTPVCNPTISVDACNLPSRASSAPVSSHSANSMRARPSKYSPAGVSRTNRWSRSNNRACTMVSSRAICRDNTG